MTTKISFSGKQPPAKKPIPKAHTINPQERNLYIASLHLVETELVPATLYAKNTAMFLRFFGCLLFFIPFFEIDGNILYRTDSSTVNVYVNADGIALMTILVG